MANEGTKVGSIFYESSIDPTGVKKGAAQIQGSLAGLTSSFKNINPSIMAVGTALAGVFAAGKIIEFFKSTVDAANESNRVMAQTQAVIESTGGVAGQTAESIAQMARNIQATTPISDEAAQAGMNMLLTFTSIRSVFPQASQVLMDTATAMNGGLTPSAQQLIDTAKQLGFAMNDPIQGISRLHRQGVNFSPEQEKLINGFVETNQLAKAQGVILQELAKEFGGSAAAQAKTFEGRIQQMANAFNDMKEAIGIAIQGGILYLMDALGGLPNVTGAVITAFRYLIAIMMTAVYVAQTLGGAISAIFAGIIGTVQGGIGLGVAAFKQGMNDMLVNAAKYQTAVTNVVMGNNQKQAGSYQKTFDAESAGSGKKTSKILKDLADENEAYADALKKRNASFQDNLADLIWAHQDKVKELGKQMADETKTFNQKIAEQTKTYNEAMAQMKADHEEKVTSLEKDLSDETATHEEKVAKIQALIDREESYGKNARQSKLAEWQQELADETTSYDKKVTDIQAKIDAENVSYANAVLVKQQANQQETADLEAAHAQQVTDYQNQINTEQGILNAHQTEVNSIKDKARVDDITRLVQQHNEENAEALKQHNKRMADITSQSTAEGGAAGAGQIAGLAPKLEDMKKIVSNTSKQMGESMVTNLVDGAITAGKKMVSEFINAIINKAKEAYNFAKKHNILGFGPLGGLDVFKSIPGFANGVRDFSGGLAMVGEHGPEIVNLPKGSDVYPAGQSGGLAQNIYVSIDHISNEQDMDSLVRELGFKISQLPR